MSAAVVTFGDVESAVVRSIAERLRFASLDSMSLFSAHSFPAKGVRSLSWRGEELVDWVGGARSFSLDGTEGRVCVNYAYRFDAATTSPDGRVAVIYERQGTKGLLLDNGRIVRELNRSFYCANAYEYPVSLFNDPGGRLLLAHCPEEYCRIELEEVATGHVLTSSEDRKPSDFFHSRLAASPSGKRLLSAGWVWHPWSAVVSFDLERALVEPTHLDRGESMVPQSGYEEGSACWLDDDVLIVGGTTDEENLDDPDHQENPANLSPCGIAVYDIAARSCIRAFRLDEPPGTILPIGKEHILSLYRHPKLIELTTGAVLHVWDEMDSGLQESSIVWGLDAKGKPPPMAFDRTSNRLAIANADGVTVIEFLTR